MSSVTVHVVHGRTPLCSPFTFTRGPDTRPAALVNAAYRRLTPHERGESSESVYGKAPVHITQAVCDGYVFWDAQDLCLYCDARCPPYDLGVCARCGHASRIPIPASAVEVTLTASRR